MRKKAAAYDEEGCRIRTHPGYEEEGCSIRTHPGYEEEGCSIRTQAMRKKAAA